MIQITQSIELLKQFVKNPSLLNHSFMVAHAMKHSALNLGLDENDVLEWQTAGLLHDLDWESYPDLHPNYAVENILPEQNYSSQIIDAIKAHAYERTGYDLKNSTKLIDKYLFANDELSGFLNAISLVRPTKFEGMEVKSVTKRLKDKAFASNVSREDIYLGANLIGKSLEEHIEFLIQAFQDFSIIDMI